MLFNSYEFALFFLPVFMVGFYIIRYAANKKQAPETVLSVYCIAGSLFFYALFGVRNILVLLASILVNLLVLKLLENESVRSSGKWFLAAGVVANCLALLFFKFKGSFFPVAISFYTFNQISFLVDFYRNDEKEKRLCVTDYLLYILFFPKLLQGPLMRFEDFEKEKETAFGAELDWDLLMRALLLFSIGLFKKVILADTFGKAVDFAYGGLDGIGSLEAVLTAVFYSFQLYFDFSGYCDVATAVCMMMGMELALNFDSPYRAVNIVDFWKRWHISLTGFFTRYIYIPLGGNRKGTVRTYLNLMIVFLISGLWHGNGLTFIIWGAMHGVLYVITRILMGNDKTIKTGNIFLRIVKTILTFAYVTAAWVFFRAGTVADALRLFGRMFTGGRKTLPAGFSSCFQLDEIWYVLKVTPIMKLSFAWDVCLWGFLLVSVFIIFFNKNAITQAKECKIGIRTTLATFVLLAWSIVSFSGVSTFLYMNF